MAEPFTSNPAEVEARWQPLTDDQEALATQLLEDAEVILTARIPTIAARVTAGTLAAALVVQAQVAMVLRVLQNPEGYLEESVGDWRGRRDKVLSAGLLYVGDNELALLLPSTQQGSAFTISPFSEPGYATSEIDYWDLTP